MQHKNGESTMPTQCSAGPVVSGTTENMSLRAKTNRKCRIFFCRSFRFRGNRVSHFYKCAYTWLKIGRMQQRMSPAEVKLSNSTFCELLNSSTYFQDMIFVKSSYILYFYFTKPISLASEWLQCCRIVYKTNPYVKITRYGRINFFF